MMYFEELAYVLGDGLDHQLIKLFKPILTVRFCYNEVYGCGAGNKFVIASTARQSRISSVICIVRDCFVLSNDIFFNCHF